MKFLFHWVRRGIEKYILYVYMILSKNEEVIYVGKTNDLSTRLRSHQENKPELWNEHTKILFNKFDNEITNLHMKN